MVVDANLTLSHPKTRVFNGDLPTSWADFVVKVWRLASYSTYWTVCSGTLLDPTTVLTAAHCDTSIGATIIMHRDASWVPQNDAMSSLEDLLSLCDEEVYCAPVLFSHTHPRYQLDGYETNDLKVLKLGASLPPTSLRVQLDATMHRNGRLMIGGYGRYDSSMQTSTHVRTKDILVPSIEYCMLFSPYTGMTEEFLFAGSTLCYEADCASGDMGADCGGDSGGPVFFRRVEHRRRGRRHLARLWQPMSSIRRTELCRTGSLLPRVDPLFFRRPRRCRERLSNLSLSRLPMHGSHMSQSLSARQRRFRRLLHHDGTLLAAQI